MTKSIACLAVAAVLMTALAGCAQKEGADSLSQAAVNDGLTQQKYSQSQISAGVAAYHKRRLAAAKAAAPVPLPPAPKTGG
jgi:outer membrane lipoprotein-sorting protein